uniref:Uncharacterized protein n=1 Tax=Strombidium rassoulzadegani TaxID=1082188 RepID=A0A7S3CNC1_9SPIT|eukprot:CAMPEP_0168611006 /NCGR_PEP_ID=MMETSP0449_2-20121227/2111_1 /TAXON_ID=1082188 /ORGANISM="Strombidium rassoulzadegani, Strain ras09" /LENGTH=242 /DNA_ID=CAMNT_0008651391 /DNA_START=10 /DNA_END=738 /DNA_ORIENTATION=+
MKFLRIAALIGTLMTVTAAIGYTERDRQTQRREIIEALTNYKLGETSPRDIILMTYKPEGGHPRVQSSFARHNEDGSDIPPYFDLFGYSEYDFIDFVQGYFSGFFGRDVRDEWSMCINDGPAEIMSIVDLVKDEASDSFSFQSLLHDTNIFQKLFVIATKLFTDGRKDFDSCKNVTSEIFDGVNFILAHLSFATITTGLLSNVWKHFFDIGTDSWSIVQGFMAHDLYLAGKSSGEVFIMLFG